MHMAGIRVMPVDCVLVGLDGKMVTTGRRARNGCRARCRNHFSKRTKHSGSDDVAIGDAASHKNPGRLLDQGRRKVGHKNSRGVVQVTILIIKCERHETH